MTGRDLHLSRVSVDLGGTRIVHRVDLDVAAGRWLALIGPNGAGKTTLVRAMAGVVDHEGTIEIGGRRLDRMKARDRARVLAVVPQQPVIPPGITVLDYTLLGRTAHQGVRFVVTEEDERTALAVLQRLDVDELAGRSLDSLSGGERQRVVVARALCQEADVLVLDEPTTALDVGHQLEVLELVEELRQERDLTVVSTIHDLGLAGQFADRCALLVDGVLVAEGPPADVLTTDHLARHYGVDAEITVGDDGRVDVAVRRRRTRAPRSEPTDPDPTGDPAGPDLTGVDLAGDERDPES